LSVAGVILFSAFVVDASGGNPIVVMNAEDLADAKTTMRPKGDIGKPPKGRKPTVNRKTAVGMV